MIAVSFALPTESAGFTALLRNKQFATCGDTKVVHGEIGNESIAILHTGVGQKICEERINRFLQTERPALLISSGFAGGADENLEVGDLFLAENFSDQQLLSTAQRVLRDRTVHTAKLFSSRTIVESVTERDEIARRNGAAAIDMETEMIARACAIQGVPLLSLRVISDITREPFPAPINVLFDIERQRTNITKLLAYLLRHPAAVWGLARFTRQIARAREQLTDAIAIVAAAL
jgi:adenosylhomocysteine nucleosidase